MNEIGTFGGIKILALFALPLLEECVFFTNSFISSSLVANRAEKVLTKPKISFLVLGTFTFKVTCTN